MIRQAGNTDASLIRDIRKACFFEDDSYLDLIVPFILKAPSICLINPEGFSNLSLLPICSYGPGGETKGYYLYGLATHPQYRKRGFATSLIEYAVNLVTNLKANFLLLLPANPELALYYRNLGFNTPVDMPDYIVGGNCIEQLNPSLLTGDNCFEQLNPSLLTGDKALEKMTKAQNALPQQYPQTQFYLWPKDMLSFIIEECEFCKGRIVKSSDGSIIGPAYPTGKNGEWEVKQVLPLKKENQSCGIGRQKRKEALAMWLDSTIRCQKGYFALGLD